MFEKCLYVCVCVCVCVYVCVCIIIYLLTVNMDGLPSSIAYQADHVGDNEDDGLLQQPMPLQTVIF